MPLILPGNVASATAATTYTVANSCRFNIADTAYLSRAWGGAGDQDKWTFSCWIKRGGLGSPQQRIFSTYVDSNNAHDIKFRATDLFVMENYKAADKGSFISSAKFRDPSAWMHMVVVWDSDNASAGSRILFYINGTLITDKTQTNPDSDEDSLINGNYTHEVGAINGGTTFGGYMAEVIFCDGQAYAASDFGEFDEDSPTIWKPKDPSGLTFGTKGFWLDFEDSSALGNDVSGNNNDFTATNLAATDQATDTPTNNFCTMNPLDNYFAASTFSEGNCKIVTTASKYTFNTGTFGLTAGKWYFEVKNSVSSDGNKNLIGISAVPSDAATNYLGEDAYMWGYYGNNGNMITGASSSSYGTAYANNDIVGVFIDLDNNKLYTADNGTINNSGTGVSLTAVASTTSGVYFPALGDYASGGTAGEFEVNFGGCPAYTISSAVADANGYGAFEYDPSDGGSSSFDSAAKDFLAICTKNLGSDGG